MSFHFTKLLKNMDIVANIRMGMGVVMGSKNLKVVAVREDIRLFSCLSKP